ncbi:nuclear transport factor 2 family protein [uncultured Erythrobacter sp.]|uniref:nuclear transport factor 2 family protein n=1 Tax=uncultured Erythrobacter sp. TaxID=263913 RepID=UPI00260E4783|nr:nuclear transport factor 2 family protein [uncultured Erythrobacter sp.]
MSRLEDVADKLECIEVVARMARGIDRCDAEIVRDCFHPGATDDHGLFKGTAADFIEWVMPVLDTMKRTQHVIGQSIIELDGDRASGESYFVAHHTIATPDGDVLMIAAGRYLDRFERRDGVWKISHRHAVYDWNSTQPCTDGWDRDDPENPSDYGVRGSGDLSYAHLRGAG